MGVPQPRARFARECADHLTPPACSQELAEGVAGARLHVVHRCGHMLTWERPHAVIELLAD